MPDYSKGKIYKLVNSVSNDCYYGSTTQPLAVRKGGHKKNYNRWKNNKSHYVTSFKLFDDDYENVDIVLIEKYPCNDKHELHARERYWIENNKCLNKYIPTRTIAEWGKKYREENVDKERKRHKKYYEENRDKESQRFKKYREENRDKELERYKKYREENADKIKEKQKKYYEVNTDKVLERCKKYREENKDRINEKIACECGSTIRRSVIARHKKTNKHQEWINNN